MLSRFLLQLFSGRPMSEYVFSLHRALLLTYFSTCCLCCPSCISWLINSQLSSRSPFSYLYSQEAFPNLDHVTVLWVLSPCIPLLLLFCSLPGSALDPLCHLAVLKGLYTDYSSWISCLLFFLHPVLLLFSCPLTLLWHLLESKWSHLCGNLTISK